MYKTVLVRQKIEDAAELLKALDALGFPVRAAAWYDDPEKLSWKLVIVTSVAANPGPLEAYLQIQRAMSGLASSVALDDIVVMSPTSRKFEEFQRTMERAARGTSLHADLPSEGVAFDDAYVYRWLNHFHDTHRPRKQVGGTATSTTRKNAATGPIRKLKLKG